MEKYAGLDVSLKETPLCIVDGAGKIICETKVASEPEVLVGSFSGELKRAIWGTRPGAFAAKGTPADEVMP